MVDFHQILKIFQMFHEVLGWQFAQEMFFFLSVWQDIPLGTKIDKGGQILVQCNQSRKFQESLAAVGGVTGGVSIINLQTGKCLIKIAE